MSKFYGSKKQNVLHDFNSSISLKEQCWSLNYNQLVIKNWKESYMIWAKNNKNRDFENADAFSKISFMQ